MATLSPHRGLFNRVGSLGPYSIESGRLPSASLSFTLSLGRRRRRTFTNGGGRHGVTLAVAGYRQAGGRQEANRLVVGGPYAFSSLGGSGRSL